MPLDEVGYEPSNTLEEICNDTMRFLEERVEQEGGKLDRCVVIIELDPEGPIEPDKATTAHLQEGDQPADLLALVMTHVKLLGAAVGMSIEFVVNGEKLKLS